MMYVYIRVHMQMKVVSALPTLIQDNQKIVVGLLAECCGSSEEMGCTIVLISDFRMSR